jgi:hypothetical protein
MVIEYDLSVVVHPEPLINIISSLQPPGSDLLL